MCSSIRRYVLSQRKSEDRRGSDASTTLSAATGATGVTGLGSTASGFNDGSKYMSYGSASSAPLLNNTNGGGHTSGSYAVVSNFREFELSFERQFLGLGLEPLLYKVRARRGAVMVNMCHGEPGLVSRPCAHCYNNDFVLLLK